MKQTPWVVMMPEGWKPGTCVCDKCFGNCVRTDVCPLANAKKAVEVAKSTFESVSDCTDEVKVISDKGEVSQMTLWDLATELEKPVTLYAVEEGK